MVINGHNCTNYGDKSGARRSTPALLILAAHALVQFKKLRVPPEQLGQLDTSLVAFPLNKHIAAIVKFKTEPAPSAGKFSHALKDNEPAIAKFSPAYRIDNILQVHKHAGSLWQCLFDQVGKGEYF